MKKILALITLTLILASASAQRFGTPPAGDNTGRTLTYTYLHKAYSSTIALKPNAYETIVNVDSLTGTCTFTASATSAKVCDKIYIILISDSATAGHVVTFGSGMNTSGTLTVAKNKRAAIQFIFNGTSWIACGREKE